MMLRIAVALILLSGCSNLWAPEATRFEPPQEYRTWWADISGCADRTGDFDAISWFLVGGDSFIREPLGIDAAGFWNPPHDIYLAERWWMNRGIVQHEMLHDLLQDGWHTHALFERCSP